MSKASKKTTRLAQLSLMIALLVVLGFTPLGFITVLPVSITIMHIPVIIGAILFGPVFGGALGLTFGIISMIKAIMAPIPPIDILFSPFASGKPVQSMIMCIVPRIVLGVAAGLLYQALCKVGKKQGLNIGISAGVATVMHTLLVLGSLWMLFSALPLRQVFAAIIGVNGLLELVAAVIVSVCVCKPLKKVLNAGR